MRISFTYRGIKITSTEMPKLLDLLAKSEYNERVSIKKIPSFHLTYGA